MPHPIQPTSQPTSKPKHPTPRDPALDGLRGVAIVLVYIFHYGGGLRSANPMVRLFGYITEAGWVGVELFFVLSGFLITRLLWASLAEPHALRHFYARRALRILPLYYAALVAAALFALGKGAHAAQLRPLLLYAGFLQNIPPLVAQALRYPAPLPLHHLWSLAVEEQFYLLWPFLLLAAGTAARARRLSLWTFGTCCVFRSLIFLLPTPMHAIQTHTTQDWSAFLLIRGGGLALGAALALHAFGQTAQTMRRRRLLLTFTVSLATFLAVDTWCGTLVLVRPAQFVVGLPAVECACAAVLALALQPGPWRALLSTAALRFLGRISYGFYVLHILLEPMFDALGRHFAHAATGSAYQLVRFVAGFPITLVAASLSLVLLEGPFLRLGRHSRPDAAPGLTNIR